MSSNSGTPTLKSKASGFFKRKPKPPNPNVLAQPPAIDWGFLYLAVLDGAAYRTRLMLRDDTGGEARDHRAYPGNDTRRFHWCLIAHPNLQHHDTVIIHLREPGETQVGVPREAVCDRVRGFRFSGLATGDVPPVAACARVARVKDIAVLLQQHRNFVDRWTMAFNSSMRLPKGFCPQNCVRVAEVSLGTYRSDQAAYQLEFASWVPSLFNRLLEKAQLWFQRQSSDVMATRRQYWCEDCFDGTNAGAWRHG